MRANSRQQVKDFFKKVKKSTAKTQKEMTEFAMDQLFKESPHVDRPDSNFSQGQYDANHKLQIEQGLVSPHNPPTGSWAASEMINTFEKEKAKNIDCGDRVEIFNTTLYNKDVEFGGPTWKRSGYYTYQIAMMNLKGKYQNVIK
jgi:hypothetical protein